MNDLEPNTPSTRELATPPTTLPKPPSGSRNPRTSQTYTELYTAADWVSVEMQIKCQRHDDESCARCVARKLYCTTTPVERKRRRKLTKY
ncbi:hypothetical protein LARI1_G007965 [Lachnellula arida]|uniref:Uncharacterized protein n=1 Tax=Lachnellula arida TaxID=1316785 RepID=A0A8T9AZ14_9HELO|nr:hypothetical protein LARI1_G007965 [Lachnellula arida]